MNGYDTEIFELHSIPGGLCTGWKRNGYTFDGCIHWLCGSRPGDDLYTIWEELGAIQGKKIVDHEIFVSTELKDGKLFNAYCDEEKLREEMMKFAPEDKELIDEFIDAINIAKNSFMPVLKAPDMYNIFDGIKLAFKDMPLIRIMGKYKKVSIEDFGKRFKNSLFNENFTELFGMDTRMPVFALVYTLGLLAKKDAGYPIGGSLEFAKSIEKRYLGLGGKVNYNSRVEKILVEGGSSKGIRLADGREFSSDIVVSAADGHYTIYNMLEGKYVDKEIEGYYTDIPLFSPIIQLSLGIAREFKEIPDALSISFPLNKAINIDHKNIIDTLAIKVYHFDPTLSPKGKTSVTTIIKADDEYWTSLKKEDPEKYRAEKERIASKVIDALEERYGNVKVNVEVADVATPDTYIRYTNNYKASFEGFVPTVESFSKKLKNTLPGLDSFYMVGQWVQPGGGLPTGGMHGRYLAQRMCKMDGKKFITAK